MSWEMLPKGGADFPRSANVKPQQAGQPTLIGPLQKKTKADHIFAQRCFSSSPTAFLLHQTLPNVDSPIRLTAPLHANAIPWKITTINNKQRNKNKYNLKVHMTH